MKWGLNQIQNCELIKWLILEHTSSLSIVVEHFLPSNGFMIWQSKFRVHSKLFSSETVVFMNMNE